MKFELSIQLSDRDKKALDARMEKFDKFWFLNDRLIITLMVIVKVLQIAGIIGISYLLCWIFNVNVGTAFFGAWLIFLSMMVVGQLTESLIKLHTKLSTKESSS